MDIKSKLQNKNSSITRRINIVRKRLDTHWKATLMSIFSFSHELSTASNCRFLNLLVSFYVSRNFPDNGSGVWLYLQNTICNAQSVKKSLKKYHEKIVHFDRTVEMHYFRPTTCENIIPCFILSVLLSNLSFMNRKVLNAPIRAICGHKMKLIISKIDNNSW